MCVCVFCVLVRRAQVALEKTVEMVQQAHVAGQELISQWENSIQQMKKKDQDLQQSALVLSSRRKTCARGTQTHVSELDLFIFSSNFSCRQRRTR